jgi:TIR domain
MEKLNGAQRAVLQAISELSKDSFGFVTDSQIAQSTRIAVVDVRDLIEILSSHNFVEAVWREADLCASITANGRIALRQLRTFENTPAQTSIPKHGGTGTSAITSSRTKISTSPQPEKGSPTVVGPKALFYSYSHKDLKLRQSLEEHLSVMQRQGLISGWHDRKITAGKERNETIDKNLNEAHIILLLISSSFLASDYCWGVEMKRTLERHERGEATVIPVILRKCDWRGAPFGKLQVLPRNGKAITSWKNRDEAFTEVAFDIRRTLEGDGLRATVSRQARSSGTADLPAEPVILTTAAQRTAAKATTESLSNQDFTSFNMYILIGLWKLTWDIDDVVITFYEDGSWNATSGRGIGFGGFIKEFRGHWTLGNKNNKMIVTQRQYKLVGFWLNHDGPPWIDDEIKSVTKGYITFMGGYKLKRVQAPSE